MSSKAETISDCAAAISDGLHEVFDGAAEQPLPVYFGRPLGWLHFTFSGRASPGAGLEGISACSDVSFRDWLVRSASNRRGR